ncbi:hypothetical protein NKG05_11580 [Oerskovia sp. M15]
MPSRASGAPDAPARTDTPGHRPFAGRHHIDFAGLATAGIFLLEGPTGAGSPRSSTRSSLRCTGRSHRRQRARTGSAPPTRRPTSSRSSTSCSRPAPASIGCAEAPSSGAPEARERDHDAAGGVRLWRLAGADQAALLADRGSTGGADPDDVPGELLSTRLDEAGLEIQRAVGLDRRQFVQTVVLPQGEFANFLRADPEHRRDLLQKVFGTEIYDRVQTQLAELHREAQRSVAAARAASTGSVENFVGAAGLTSDDATSLREAARDDAHLAGPVEAWVEGPQGAPDGPALSVRTLVARHVAALRQSAEELGAQEIAANSVLVAAREALESARVLSAAVTRRDALLAEQAVLTAAAEQVAHDRRALAAARRAAVVEPVLAGARRAAQEAAAAQERLLLARTGIPISLATADESTLEVLRSSLAAAGTRLTRLLPVGESLPVRERELVDGRKEVDRDREERSRTVADLEARPASEPASRCGGTSWSRSPVGSESGRSGSSARSRSWAQRARPSRRASPSTRRGRAGRAPSRLSVLRRTASTGCALPGSAGSPATSPQSSSRGARARSAVRRSTRPALTGAEHVGREAVEAAEAARRDAESVLADASGELATLTERLDGLLRAADGVGVDEAREKVASAKDLVAESAAAVAERAEAAAALTAFDTETAASTALASRLAERMAGETARLDALATGIERDRLEIATELDATGPLLADAALPDPLADEERPRTPSPCSRQRSATAVSR